MHFLLVATLFFGSESRPNNVFSEYGAATKAALAHKKMLLVDFATNTDYAQFDSARMNSIIVCKLPAGYKTTVEGKEQELARHPSFSDIEGSEGIVIVDYKDDAYKGLVVSALPMRHCTSDKVAALIDLPCGSITQRTLIWALRIHPQRPMSAWGTPCPSLMAHADHHSQVQAASNNQHHNMPMGIAQSEIVAESWPWNHNMCDAAIDMVHAWSQSPGHWGAACRPYTWIGYDMKTYGNKWFATGVFRF